MRPRQEHVSPQPGQKRIVAPSHLVPRASVNQPIIRIVARQLVEESNREHGHEPPPILLELLEILAMRIDALANEPNWKNILTQPPDYQRNRVFELHYELGGYPAFNLFAAQLHRGLIAHIREVESETNEVRDQILRATLTAPRALIPVIPESWLRTVTANDVSELRLIFQTAAQRLENIENSTRLEYVNELLTLITSAADPRVREFKSCRWNISDTESDFDDVVETHSERGDFDEAHEDDLNELGYIGIAERTSFTNLDLFELNGLDRKRARRQAQWIASRKTFDANVTVASPSVIPLHEIALGYQCVLQRPNDAIQSQLNRVTQFVVFDLLVHTGRPADWITAIELGACSPELSGYPAPIFDPEFGCIFYTPQSYPTIPSRLQPPMHSSPERIANWKVDLERHAFAHIPLEFIYHLPLSPTQVALLNWLMEIRRRAIESLPHVELGTFDADAGALFLVPDQEGFRQCQPNDIKNLWHEIAEHIAQVHWCWSKRGGFNFSKSFDGYYVSRYGLNPILATYVSGHVPKHLECPVHYSLVNTSQLAAEYHGAQAAFRADIEREFALSQRESQIQHLPWLDLKASETESSAATSLGSWRCPRAETVQTIITSLAKATQGENPQQAHNARVTLLAVLLQVTTGVRPYEIAELLRTSIDFSRQELTIGHAGRYHKRPRQVPIATQLVPLIQCVLQRTRERSQLSKHSALLWLYDANDLIPATQARLENIWREAGLDEGLAPSQIPSLYSLRHLYASHALAAGIPNHIVRAMMGHQAVGSALFNADLQRDVHVVFKQARQFAEQMLQELGYDASQF